MKKYFLPLLAVLPLFALLLSCKQAGAPATGTGDLKGVDLSFIDTTVKPGDNFFQYANGAWLKRTEIPATEATWGAFNELYEQNLNKLRDIAESATKANASKGSNQQLVGDFFASAMDSAGVEAQGLNAIKKELDQIAAIKTADDVMSVSAFMNAREMSGLFGVYFGQDEKKSDQIITHFYQADLGLPDCDYFKRTDAASKELLNKYQQHIVHVLHLTGDDDATASKNAAIIFNIENQFAKASMNSVEQRDIEKQYNKMTLDALQKMTPNLNWKTYCTQAGINNISEVIIAQPAFFKSLNTLIKSLPVDQWKTFLRFKFIDNMSGKLQDALVKERFDFYGKTLSGSKEMKPRWKRAIQATDDAVGDAFGQLFVEKHFTADAKKRVNELVDNLTAAYRERIKTRDWMSDSTKQQAYKKLDKVMRKLGFPDKWKSYEGLELNRNTYAENHLNAANMEFKRQVDKLGKPVDRTEWGMTAPTINAYYNPSMNEIVFPAGIMQYPFFDINQDDALNYGGMGAVIGHELTHGFDDQGSQFDADGNLKNWWSKEDNAKFKSKTGMVVNQFNNYVAIDSLHVIGALTLGENIADLGGLTIAYYAYQKSLEGKDRKTIDGFTPEQRFFMGWGRVWCEKYRPEALKQQVLTNPHSPSEFRVVGPLSNMKEFYDAFSVKEGDKMYLKPENRAEIW